MYSSRNIFVSFNVAFRQGPFVVVVVVQWLLGFFLLNSKKNLFIKRILFQMDHPRRRWNTIEKIFDTYNNRCEQGNRPEVCRNGRRTGAKNKNVEKNNKYYVHRRSSSSRGVVVLFVDKWTDHTRWRRSSIKMHCWRKTRRKIDLAAMKNVSKTISSVSKCHCLLQNATVSNKMFLTKRHLSLPHYENVTVFNDLRNCSRRKWSQSFASFPKTIQRRNHNARYNFINKLQKKLHNFQKFFVRLRKTYRLK